MKNSKKALPLVTVLAGTAAMALRRQLYLTAVDGKGLLLRYTPLELALLALTAAVFCLVLPVLGKDRGSDLYEDNYSAGVPAALGHVAAAVGIFTALPQGMAVMTGNMGKLWDLLRMAAAVCLLLAGFFRLLGKKPFFLLHVIPCLFFLVHTVSRYQLWSSNPQTQDFLFAVLAVAGLALFSYHTAAFEADMGSRKWVLGSGLLSVYLCLAELGWSDSPGLYFGCMFWALTGMCRISGEKE